MMLRSFKAPSKLVAEQGLQLKDFVQEIALKALYTHSLFSCNKWVKSTFQRDDKLVLREEYVYFDMKMSLVAFEGFSLPVYAHLFYEILSISTNIVHSVFMDSEISFKCFVLFQQALQTWDTETS